MGSRLIFIKLQTNRIDAIKKLIEFDKDVSYTFSENENKDKDLLNNEIILENYYKIMFNEEIIKVHFKVVSLIEKFIFDNNIRGVERRELKSLLLFFKPFSQKYELCIFSHFLSIFIIKSIVENSAIKNSSSNIYTFKNVGNIINITNKQLEKWLMWLELKQKKKIIFTKKNKLIFRVISLLEDQNVVLVDKYYDNTTGIKTQKRLYFKENLTSSDICIGTGISLVPYKILFYNNELFIYNSHFSTLKIVFKKNVYSNKIFELENLEDINKLAQNGVYIDWDLYALLLNEIIEHYNIDLKKIDVNIKELKKNIDNVKNQKLLSLLLTIKNYLNFFELKKYGDIKFYFEFSFDFRGRLYYDSPHSPTNSKITRLSVHYGYYSSEEIKDIVKTKTWEITEKYMYLIEDIKNPNDKINHAIFWLLIGLGKIEKKN